MCSITISINFENYKCKRHFENSKKHLQIFYEKLGYKLFLTQVYIWFEYLKNKKSNAYQLLLS